MLEKGWGITLLNLTELINEEIKKNYKSLKSFANELGVPYTTLISSLKHGVENTSFLLVSQICNKLNISICNIENQMLTKEHIHILDKYNKLSDAGKTAINAIFKMEENTKVNARKHFEDVLTTHDSRLKVSHRKQG